MLYIAISENLITATESEYLLVTFLENIHQFLIVHHKVGLNDFLTKNL